jgi:homoserine dehydrogenase
VVETIGGTGIAYTFTKRALSLGKHVVTSNKELVATHGPELLRLAKENKVNYLFEASVGGGIPIIRPLHQCLAANELCGITGILNGTTNFILTKMKREHKDFNEALLEAQQNGYAEADPTADIEGHDACRKIAILSSIAYNEYVDYKKIITAGIGKVSLSDMEYADSIGANIKLIAKSDRIGNNICAWVSPTIVYKTHPLSNVEDVFNAILVKGDAIGETMFYGRGAGKLPTASAVVADVIDIVKSRQNTVREPWQVSSGDNIVPSGEIETKYYLRVITEDYFSAKKLLEKFFRKPVFLHKAEEDNRELVLITDKIISKDFNEYLDNISDSGMIRHVASVMRVLEE